MVDVEVVDAAENRCPTALNTIKFALSGPAEWRGGIAQDDDRPDNYILSKTLPVQCGINRVILRAATRPGRITLRASAPGLRSTSLTFRSHAVKVVGGLSADLPGMDLPPDLERGPTPHAAPLPLTRHPIIIAGVRAGANSDQAGLSCDDNEATSWSSDGKLSTAWIQYNFSRTEAVNQVTLKMAGWRQRSYPVRISVDGKAVVSGATPRSFGYVTLSFAPATGKSMKIEMIGLAGDKGLTVPVAPATTTGTAGTPAVVGAGVADTSAVDPNARGTLSIVEAEIYGPRNSPARYPGRKLRK